MFKVVFAVWLVVVTGVSLAKAQDAVVTVPPACHVDAASFGEIHAVLCGNDTACTQRLVDLVCGKAVSK